MTNGLVKKGIPLKRVIYLIALLCWLCSSLAHATLLSFNPETVEAEAWTVLDPQSGQVIAEHNSQIQRAPASLTKMMTSYIVEHALSTGRLKESDPVSVSEYAWCRGTSAESCMYLPLHGQAPVIDMLRGVVRYGTGTEVRNRFNIAADIAGSQLVLFDDLGHVPQEEDALRTVAVLAAFLLR